MATTTVSSKGQITLPAALLRERHVLPGSRFEVVGTSTAIVLLPVDGSIVDALSGATRGAYGDVEDYIEAERSEWTSPM
jgi:bifunctional DNA-binding transcriptional regulator/antitoxin component of YhaV-PrlF toxin-antitoxin module